MDLEKIPVKLVRWLPCWRIIPSRFPPVSLFERVASIEEFEAIYEVEQLTNPRLRNEIGDIQCVPAEEMVFGEGNSHIMAAFTHINPEGSRFTDGMYGVYYAGDKIETAVAETKYHREFFFKSFKSPKIEVDMRVLLADLRADLHDISHMKSIMPEVYHAENYSASQALAKKLRGDGRATSSWGLKYDSVRYEHGECVAIFRPKALSNCRQERHLCYVWDGEKISHIYRKQLELC